jgi:hypothetical protein
LVSQAHQARKKKEWQPQVEAEFYAALGRIAHIVLPVRAETTGDEARRGARRAIKIYSYFTIPLTVTVIALSCVLFIANQLSDEVSSLVKSNDIGAMQLHNELESHEASIIEAKQKGEREIRAIESNESLATKLLPGDDPSVVDAKEKSQGELRAISNSQTALQIKDNLQQFAVNNRQLYNDIHRIRVIGSALDLPVNNPYYSMANCTNDEADQFRSANSDTSSDSKNINWACDTDKIRKNLEINLPILEADHVFGEKNGEKDKPLAPENDVDEGFEKIATYQDIRAMAMYGRDIILSLVGMVTGFVLPVLYAWLGACAAILRKINSECASNMFHPENSKVANRSHITCAIIIGIAIGLLSDLIEGGKSFSPLAIAFIAGYASNKFFYFVDRLVETLFPARTPDEVMAQDGRPPERSVPATSD